ncbi:MAG: putative LPS assembly protein LptD [candidate division KSB1 bacterium]|nr:putative LPS assembly protein LptD [candidate division KSB1 bacterium]MDZ7334123.1 putative LPS assembly protein LptD [candidate division KSB1 bacterium]MDZ7356288.1 putative LPS assembly protein LptD [candidate division KSB1 bacterium]MDZ7401381.1 putative LPS assembly protein LptD [candidate division KSB1 bacterium]
MQYRISSIIIIALIIILFRPNSVCWGQNTDPSAHRQQITIPEPSKIPIDTVRDAQDSLRTPKTSSVGLDTILNYQASIVDTRVPEKKIYLIGKADVKYKTIHLTAGKITLDWDAHLITAEGLPDTVYQKTGNPGDSVMTVIWRELPTLSDAGEVMNGFKMIYNYKTEKGRVIQGRTEFEGGFYRGESMKRVSDKIINISNGYFTSCDKEDVPHYHFRSRRIKVIMDDKVIAQPVVMYFNRIPVAALPFVVFPNKKGRVSGVLVPTYGESAKEGRFIRGLGYYWAASDYWDTALKVDYFDRAGWVFRGDVKYNVRYLLNGAVSGSFTHKDLITGSRERRWDLIVNHSQIIDPTMSLAIYGQFISDQNFYRDFSSNFDTRLNRRIRSDATFSKSWPEKRLNLSANLSQEQDIQTGQVSRTLPQLRFTVSQRAIFGRSKQTISGGFGSSAMRSRAEPTWYESIYFSYNSSLQNSTTRGGKSANGSPFPERTTRYISHNASLSMNTPRKIFGWLTLGQSLNYDERWYDRYRKNTFNPETNTVKQDTVSGFAALRTFYYSMNASTKIYGMFAPGIGKIQALRHVVTPNISFNYQPDFSDPRWGYFDTFVDTTGKIIKKEKFLDYVPSGGRKNISFSLGNLFQMKTQDGDKEKKFDLFTVNFSSAYNFEATSFKFSYLSTSFQASPSRNFNISMSATHDFYEYDLNKRQRVNRLLFMDDDAWRSGKVLRLINFQIGAQLRLQGEKKKSVQKPETPTQTFEDEITGEQVSEQEYLDRLYEPAGNRFEVNDRFSGLDIPWRMSLSFSFSLQKFDPTRPVKNYYVDITGLEFQLTRNWKINYSAHLDLASKQIVNHSITINRDLHCWEARLIWRPSGIGGNSYYLRINVKAPQLRDLKYEKRGGRSSVWGY